MQWSNRRRFSPLVLALPAFLGVIAACGDQSGSCGPAAVEPIDSRLYHLLPGAPAPDYLTDPPTSGPHVSGLRVSGVRTEPMTGIEQVSTLELGVVIVQYGAKVGDDGRSDLEDLAPGGNDSMVAVAPSGHDDDAVVVTGWITKMRCTGVDVDAVKRFIDDHRAKGTAPGPGS